MYYVVKIAKVVFPSLARSTDLVLLCLILVIGFIGGVVMLVKDHHAVQTMITAVLDDRAGTATVETMHTRDLSVCRNAPRYSCVVDGDTLWLEGEKMRLERIDTPELSHPQCQQEHRLAIAARDRLISLLQTKPWRIERRGQDRYGRTLVRLRSPEGWLADHLVREGLARPWEGARQGWC